MLATEIKKQKDTGNKFRILLEAAPDGMIIASDKGDIILVNRQSEQLFGYTKEELIGKPVEILIPAYFFIIRARQKTHYTKAPKVSSAGTGLELFARTKDGIQFPLDVSISPVMTDEGTLLFVSVRDITESKNIEDRLRKSQKDFQLLVSSVKDCAIFMLDVNGNVATWNSGAENIKGYTEEEIIGKNIEVFYTAEEARKGEPVSNLQKALKEGHFETEGLRLRKNGSSFYANVVFTALYDDNKNLYGYAKVTRDITEKKKIHEGLRYMATIANNIHDPVISSGNDSFITGWNDAAEKLFEWKIEEVIGKNMDSLLSVYYPRESKTETEIAFQKYGSWQGELIYYTKAHKPVYVAATLLPLMDSNGAITGNIIIAKNITETKKTEEALSKFNCELEQRVKERTEYIYKSEILFRSLIEHSNDIFLMLDENFKIIYWSSSSERATGWNDEEMIHADGSQSIHPDDKDSVKNIFLKAMINPGRIMKLLFRSRHKNGTYMWLEGTIINLLFNKYTKALVVSLHDVTESKMAEEKLTQMVKELTMDKHALY